MKNVVRLAAAAAAAVALLNLAGCATPATSQAMTVKPGTVAPANPRLKSAMAIADVRGGKETNPLWTSQVDAAGFRKALNDSLAIAGYTAPDAATAKYKVSAELLSLDQPLVGFTMDVKSRVRYQVTGGAAPRTFDITATGTASPSDAFMAFERLRLANERSVLENIKEFMNRLSAFTD
ncbi:MAG TPA: hypothetical protein VNB23_07745 [Ramlibacter sp.]|nr:hypothetical protein [Ramlibacter sp.]